MEQKTQDEVERGSVESVIELLYEYGVYNTCGLDAHSSELQEMLDAGDPNCVPAQIVVGVDEQWTLERAYRWSEEETERAIQLCRQYREAWDAPVYVPATTAWADVQRGLVSLARHFAQVHHV